MWDQQEPVPKSHYKQGHHTHQISLTPLKVFECLGYGYGFKVIFGMKLGSEIEFLNWFVDVVFGPGDYDGDSENGLLVFWMVGGWWREDWDGVEVVV